MSHPQSARGDPVTVSNDATYGGGALHSLLRGGEWGGVVGQFIQWRDGAC